MEKLLDELKIASGVSKNLQKRRLERIALAFVNLGEAMSNPSMPVALMGHKHSIEDNICLANIVEEIIKLSELPGFNIKQESCYFILTYTAFE